MAVEAAAKAAAEAKADEEALEFCPRWARDEVPCRRAAKNGGGFMVGVPPRRFDVQAETQEWLAYLDECGYVVLAGVAGAAALAQAEEHFWNWMEAHALRDRELRAHRVSPRGHAHLEQHLLARRRELQVD